MKLVMIATGVALLGGACATKTDDARTAPAKSSEPARAAAPKLAVPVSEPAPKAAPSPAPVPKPAKFGVDDASDRDKNLVRAAQLRPELVWTAPTGDKIKIAATKRIKRDTFVVDIVVGTGVVETIDTGAEKPDETGFVHYEPRAGVAQLTDGVLVVAGATKVTGKADDSYDARVLAWDAAKKQLVVARSIRFEDAYDPSRDD